MYRPEPLCVDKDFNNYEFCFKAQLFWSSSVYINLCFTYIYDNALFCWFYDNLDILFWKHKYVANKDIFVYMITCNTSQTLKRSVSLTCNTSQSLKRRVRSTGFDKIFKIRKQIKQQINFQCKDQQVTEINNVINTIVRKNKIIISKLMLNAKIIKFLKNVMLSNVLWIIRS